MNKLGIFVGKKVGYYWFRGDKKINLCKSLAYIYIQLERWIESLTKTFDWGFSVGIVGMDLVPLFAIDSMNIPMSQFPPAVFFSSLVLQ